MTPGAQTLSTLPVDALLSAVGFLDPVSWWQFRCTSRSNAALPKGPGLLEHKLVQCTLRPRGEHFDVGYVFAETLEGILCAARRLIESQRRSSGFDSSPTPMPEIWDLVDLNWITFWDPASDPDLFASKEEQSLWGVRGGKSRDITVERVWKEVDFTPLFDWCDCDGMLGLESQAVHSYADEDARQAFFKENGNYYHYDDAVSLYVKGGKITPGQKLMSLLVRFSEDPLENNGIISRTVPTGGLYGYHQGDDGGMPSSCCINVHRIPYTSLEERRNILSHHRGCAPGGGEWIAVAESFSNQKEACLL